MNASTRAFVDTNVFVYLLSGDKRKSDIAESLLTAPDLERVISTQVINEFANTARRKAGLEWPEIRAFVDVFREACEVEVIDGADQDMAFEIADGLGFDWYDSLIVATALRSGTSILLTEDLQHRQRIDALTVVDPFVVP